MLEMDGEYEGNVEATREDYSVSVESSSHSMLCLMSDLLGQPQETVLLVLSSKYSKRGIEPNEMEELYKNVHAAIRADPSIRKSTKEPPKEHKRYNLKKLTYEKRKARLIERFNTLNAGAVRMMRDLDEN